MDSLERERERERGGGGILLTLYETCKQFYDLVILENLIILQ